MKKYFFCIKFFFIIIHLKLILFFFAFLKKLKIIIEYNYNYIQGNKIDSFFRLQIQSTIYYIYH
jgi:hypothetical protein